MPILSNNFNFLNKYKFENKDEVINGIADCERRVKLHDFGPMFNSIRTIFDKILDNIVADYSISVAKNSTYEKAKAIIDQYGGNLNDWETLSFGNCRLLGNVGSHNLEHEELDAIYQLKNIQTILKTYFKKFLNINDEFPNFIISPYQANSVLTNTNPIVSRDDIESNEANGPSVLPDLRIDKLPISQLLGKENRKFIIPIYQRKYSWNEGNIKTLIDDIDLRTKDNNSHFFGTISAKPLKVSTTSEFNEIKIIDGQQRLTTSMLLFCAVREIMSSDYKIDYKQETSLKNVLKINGRQKLSKYFVNPGGTDVANFCFSKILDDNIDKITEEEKTKNYYINFQYLIKQIKLKTKNIEELRNFLCTYMRSFVVGVIDFDADVFKNKREMEIFQNLNSKGSPLSPYDLIKNYLLNLCDEYTINHREKEIVVAYNSAIESIWINSKVEKIVDFFDSFIHYFTGENVKLKTEDGQQQTESVAKLHALKEALRNYDDKTCIEHGLNYDQFVGLINDIGSYLKVWIDAEKANKGNSEYLQKIGVNKIFTYGQKAIKNKCFYTMTFLYFDLTKYRKNLDRFDINIANKKIAFEYFLIIYKALIKETVIEGRGSSNFNNNCYRLSREMFLKLNQLDSVEKCNDYMKIEFAKFIPTDTEFKNKLEINQKDEWFHKPILEFVEWQIMGRENGGESINEKRTLEHIMPQDPKKWIPDIMKWNNISNEQSAINDHSKFLNKIGNYMLLTETINKSVKNDSFEQKNKEFLKKIISPLYKSNFCDLDVSAKKIWSFEDITKRSTFLINFICSEIFTF